ncbi:TylF/MycF/NovP-related O-methyltransferase [Lysobacter solisilvae (ex Woo and Kim 2020)]|uniref:Class I SAM-dependent methyltransferase n=1 Tax=Agrilutibacter terrestris TaxID=2865112 RepID=A0A7H0FZR8_9GAMM|nr:TylF/MycF/NovP-related O-methyltransferase [Lysobacter terrestris]QNP41534.1 class I SAM-dependent methyltransferase [Lysobacter terrestris]
MDDIVVARLGRPPGRRHRIANELLARLGTRMRVSDPPYRWGYGNVESHMNVFHLASQTCAYGVPGDLVELGCATGESSVVIQSVLSAGGARDKRFHVYDSFSGLPEPADADASDGIYHKGDMVAPLERFEETFVRAGLAARPTIHVGWFDETVPAQLPDRISFAMIDCDLYSSTKLVLPHIYARMSPGAIAMFGVYYDPEVYAREGIRSTYASPGVKRATDEFFADKPEQVSVLYANEYSNGYFRKQ